MKNFLITFDHWDATQFRSDHWSVASSFFGTSQKFLNAIATMAVIVPKQTGEQHDQELSEVANTLIGYRMSDNDESHPPGDLSDIERDQVIEYLIECNRAMRPYMPGSGTCELRAVVTSPEFKELYLIITHYDDQELLDTPGAEFSLRLGTTVSRDPWGSRRSERQ